MFVNEFWPFADLVLVYSGCSALSWFILSPPVEWNFDVLWSVLVIVYIGGCWRPQVTCFVAASLGGDILRALHQCGTSQLMRLVNRCSDHSYRMTENSPSKLVTPVNQYRSSCRLSLCICRRNIHLARIQVQSGSPDRHSVYVHGHHNQVTYSSPPCRSSTYCLMMRLRNVPIVNLNSIYKPSQLSR